MSLEEVPKKKPITRLRKPKSEFLALTTKLDQELLLEGSLRAAGLTCKDFDHSVYIFGSIQQVSHRHYCTGDDGAYALDIIKCRIFDLSRVRFLGITDPDAAIEQDIIVTFTIEKAEEPYSTKSLYDYNVQPFISCLGFKTDEEIVNIISDYVTKLQKLEFVLTEIDYRPEEYAGITFVKDKIKILVSYYIKDHLNNIDEYHLE